MKIQPIQNQTFNSRYKIEKFKCYDKYISHHEHLYLNNGKKLTVVTEYGENGKETVLQCLYDEAGKWIKSKLRYFKDNKVTRTLRGERNEYISKN